MAGGPERLVDRTQAPGRPGPAESPEPAAKSPPGRRPGKPSGGPPAQQHRVRSLPLVRAAWVSIAALIFALVAAGVPVTYEQYAAVCAGADCAGWRLAPQDVSALGNLGLSVSFYAAYLLGLQVLHAVGFLAAGVLVFWKRSDEWVAMVISLALISFGAIDLSAPLPQAHAWLRTPVSLLEFLGTALFVVSFMVFPDGRFVPRWTRWAALVWVLYQASGYLFPSSLISGQDASRWLNASVWLTLLCVLVGARMYRYRRVASTVERQQTKLVVFGLSAALLAFVAVALVGLLFPTLVRSGGMPGMLYVLVGATVLNVAFLLVPLSISLAVLRYRLWDVDPIINRAVVYAVLTASTVGLYALLVGTLGSLFGARSGNFAVSLLAAGTVAVLFAPLRERLQRGVNRMMYGERDDPYRVLSRLGRRLEATFEPEAILPTIVETVREALKLPYAAIAMKRGEEFRVAAAHGSPTGEQIALPLTYGGENVGELILAPRAPGESLSEADRRLLVDLARSAEVAVHAVRLTQDLQRSREKLVNLREEERRRLRRDLHDGLGPTLGSLTLGLDVSRRLMKRDPEQAEAMLEQLKDQTKDAVADIRRLVYGLRPPALDDLGLVGAIRELAAKHGHVADRQEAAGTGREGVLDFFVETPDELPDLPAAVEVACYRIAQEAITNVVRHARAGSCRVSVAIEKRVSELKLEITDDGVGLPKHPHAGVGTASMPERAEELGGECSVEANPAGGTRVVARLPLPTDEE